MMVPYILLSALKFHNPVNPIILIQTVTEGTHSLRVPPDELSYRKIQGKDQSPQSLNRPPAATL